MAKDEPRADNGTTRSGSRGAANGTRSGGSGARRPRSRWKSVFSFLFSCIVIGGFGMLLGLLYLRSQALPAVSVSQTSQIYDAQGKLIGAMNGGENRQVVPLKDVSPTFLKAILAVEDHRFYEHVGFDPKGMARAAATNLKTLSKEQGASTITQQLARNLYLNHDRTWSRKVKELMYAVQLEMQLSKDQILEQYVNQIYFGHSTYGVQAAAQMFFGKDAKDLDLAEAALLAGVPKGPKYYSPYLDMDNAKQRQKIILDKMADYGDITEAEAGTAYAEQLTIIPRKTEQPTEAPYFREYIRTLVTQKYEIDEKTFDSGGIKIFTTLDLNAQRAAEEAIAKQIDKTSGLQAALIAIDPRNGYIKAMVGGKNYGENQFNRVFANSRQPGSAFKAIVYLAALQNGFTPISRYKSEPTSFPYDENRKTYTPSNFSNRYFGDIDMRTAISKSDNIYAVHTLMDVGAEKVIELARKMGITSPLEAVPSLALGTSPVSPFEMASAFGTIANQGIRVEPTAILRIEDSRGRVLVQTSPSEQRVSAPAYTYVLTGLMESVFEEGGTGFRVSDVMKRPVAGKSGTTDSDAWMVGFTPELSTAVWVGYDRDRNISTLEQYKAAPIFAEFTERTLEAIPPKLFPMPEGVTNVYIDTVTGKLANDACTSSRLETFVSGTEPTEYCAESKTGVQPPQPNGSKQKKSWWDDLKRWWNE
ncbi:transglycosylase domain-containing protein [Paenibacillus contaminans]|uniref:Carboxypeptidase n=1 Tax=Paenibacillus contaminans TaxID=450362 RepID=A0A329LZ08_9BACL|nr:PBP1A family penicillin-binding protein [Paenibacillus contaminans]RAV12512.1 carboxypeptidase [Paenibacillus contaminans]